MNAHPKVAPEMYIIDGFVSVSLWDCLRRGHASRHLPPPPAPRAHLKVGRHTCEMSSRAPARRQADDSTSSSDDDPQPVRRQAFDPMKAMFGLPQGSANAVQDLRMKIPRVVAGQVVPPAAPAAPPAPSPDRRPLAPPVVAPPPPRRADSGSDYDSYDESEWDESEYDETESSEGEQGQQRRSLQPAPVVPPTLPSLPPAVTRQVSAGSASTQATAPTTPRVEAAPRPQALTASPAPTTKPQQQAPAAVPAPPQATVATPAPPATPGTPAKPGANKADAAPVTPVKGPAATAPVTPVKGPVTPARTPAGAAKPGGREASPGHGEGPTTVPAPGATQEGEPSPVRSPGGGWTRLNRAAAALPASEVNSIRKSIMRAALSPESDSQKRKAGKVFRKPLRAPPSDAPPGALDDLVFTLADEVEAVLYSRHVGRQVGELLGASPPRGRLANKSPVDRRRPSSSPPGHHLPSKSPGPRRASSKSPSQRSVTPSRKSVAATLGDSPSRRQYIVDAIQRRTQRPKATRKKAAASVKKAKKVPPPPPPAPEADIPPAALRGSQSVEDDLDSDVEKRVTVGGTKGRAVFVVGNSVATLIPPQSHSSPHRQDETGSNASTPFDPDMVQVQAKGITQSVQTELPVNEPRQVVVRVLEPPPEPLFLKPVHPAPISTDANSTALGYVLPVGKALSFLQVIVAIAGSIAFHAQTMREYP